ncbi:hypothetical protein G9A89_014313 [Geosiphon pyriformis]|nr:hypothetical protein G9A89_014313 [Geosiphon pyriformis]
MENYEQNWEKAIKSLNGNTAGFMGLRNMTKAFFTVMNWMDPNRFKPNHSYGNLSIGFLLTTIIKVFIIIYILIKHEGIPQEVHDSVNILLGTPLEQRLIEWYLDAVYQDFSKLFNEKLQRWRDTWKNFRANHSSDDSLEVWVAKSYTEIISEIHSHYKKCETLFLILANRTEAILLYELRYNTMLHSSLQDQSKPYSATSSSFKEMTKLVYRRNYKIFVQLRKNQVSLPGTSLSYLNKKDSPLNESELFTWKSKDDLNAIVASQEKGDNRIEQHDLSIDDTNLSSDEESEESCEEAQNFSSIEDITTDFRTFLVLCKQLDELDLIVRTKDILEELLCELIEERIQKTCGKVFDKPHLRRSTNWLYSSLYSWLQVVLLPEIQANTETAKEKMTRWSQRLNYHFCMVFCDLRISQMFDLIVDFPESKPAIEDLLMCMDKLDQDHRYRLVQSLHSSFRKRLLIPGATTTDILKTYISTIKCLRLLDPPGVLLEKVTSSIRSYLRGRSDTVQCLVSCWMDEKNPNSELIEELGRATIPVPDHEDENAEFDNDNWGTWVPDPMDAGPNYKSTIYRSADITNILISIFDNPDVIIEEIQKQMAYRLLAITDYDTTKEALIFNIADSKRMDNLVHTCGYLAPQPSDGTAASNSEESGEAPLHAHIISKLFWPPPKNEELLPPDPIQDMVYKFEGTYTIHKQRRKLEWFPNLGTVDLKIELEDRTLELSVAPVYATIIYHFQKQETWWLDALADKMNMDPAKLRKKIPFWIDRGVLKSVGPDLWKLLEKSEGTNAGAFISTDESNIAIQTIERERLDELRVYWTFIQTMLTNLGALSLDRIHNMLITVVQTPRYTAKVDELKEYLGLCMREEKIEQIGSLYQLKDL